MIGRLCWSGKEWSGLGSGFDRGHLGIPAAATIGPVTAEKGTRDSSSSWTFLTNHGHVLVCIAYDPGIRGRDIAARVGITERAAQAIVADLVREGYVTRTKVGRRNVYRINPDRPLRHPCEQPHSIGELLRVVAEQREPEPESAPAAS
jgi:hypothetical protein